MVLLIRGLLRAMQVSSEVVKTIAECYACLTLSSVPLKLTAINMSSDPKLDVALKILKLAGHQIGDAHIPPPQDGDTMRVWIAQIFRHFREA